MAALLIIAISLIICYLYNLVTTAQSYWKRKGIKGPKPHPLFGNIKTVIRTKEDNIHTLVDRIYKDYPNEAVVGIYQGLIPTLIVKDPDLIKAVLIKDFNHFVNRGIRVGNDPITKNLFAVDGDEWKTLRQKLTPIFSTGKLKGMMPLMNTCVEQFMEHVDSIVDIDNGTPRDVRNLMMKYTMKSITSIAFGIEVNTFGETPTEFEKMADKVFKPSGLRRFAFFINNFCPDLLEYLHINASNRDVANFFLKLVKEIVKEREGKPKVRKDFIDLIIELKEEGTITREKDGKVIELEITDELITAQAIVFYAAGFETSSGTMSFLLYELAKNPEVQERCREEIDKVMKKYNGKLDYDALKELEYVSMALDETLRMYPVAGTLFRQCVEEYTFPKVNLTIDKGTKVWIPLLPMQMNPDVFPQPKQFRPERFSQENKEVIHDYYMPFGDGPRICIGLRFARVQSLLGIANFLHRFRVSACKGTPEQIIFDPRQVTLASIDGIRLNIEKRKYIAPKPNTYTFTKAIAENVVEQHDNRSYSVAIFRPSIVISSCQNPFPGWIENLNGPSGIAVAAGKGLLHVFTCKTDARADMIPVDVCIDTLIAAGWETAVDRLQEVRVYNCSTYENPITWGQFESALRKYFLSQYPLDKVFWYPYGSATENIYIESIFGFLLQTVPMHVAEYIARFFGIKRRVSLITAEQKMRSLTRVLTFFSLKEFRFDTSNVRRLRSRLSPDDAKIYNLDIGGIVWEDVCRDFAIGTRKYLLGEKDQDLDEAKRHLKRMWYLHNAVTLTSMLLFLRLLLRNQFIKEFIYGAVKLMASLFTAAYSSVLEKVY